MSDHDLLPVDWILGLPTVVCDRLVDCGLACNEASSALDVSLHLFRAAGHSSDVATACGAAGGFRHHLAEDLAQCANSYIDQLVVAYTKVATWYAVEAAQVAAAVFARQPLTTCDTAMRPPPSQVLAHPDQALPLLRLPAGTIADEIRVDHDQYLADQHRRALAAVAAASQAHPLNVYDAPPQVAASPRGTVDLLHELPDALHAYAAACVWGIGLACRPPEEPAFTNHS